MSNHRGAPPKVPRLTITLDSDDMRIIFDKPAQRLRIMKLDGGGLPIGRIEEHTFADALNILHEAVSAAGSSAPTPTHEHKWIDGPAPSTVGQRQASACAICGLIKSEA